MPIHDWTRVEAGIFHAFHHRWISSISDSLNSGVLPSDYYALPEQQTSALGPDVLTLEARQEHQASMQAEFSYLENNSNVAVLTAPPKTQFTAETDEAFYRRKKKRIAIRHVSRDNVVAIIELVSPGNKSSNSAFHDFVGKVCELLEHQIHMLVVDLFPPTKRDPQGVHAALWEEIANQEFTPPEDKPLTLVAYESALQIKAYIEPIAVGDVLPDMPVVLEPGAYVPVPLENTYQEAWSKFPQRWRRVLENPPMTKNN